ncbi:putative ribonuclease H-like domain-containing protein [Tanacetum coccineum]|uniref:Ribonuclease H-like domain-containing protein n=1 Tax=Tanacetum coccineum TaxID=301880 RepID=A0ABQ4XAL1_9ASTR
MKKMYCLVVTDDYSRFTWVFFLATKDETSGILKSFITGIENLIGHKVKVIRCDNGTEFKNREMNQFYEKKGILRQYSVARTPQQNGVIERRNRTLIKAARTMLADSKLPTTFWVEAVNTACYVQNKVLVVKPHNKTPYELIHGKFDGKADEGAQSNGFAGDDEKKVTEEPEKEGGDPSKEGECNDQEKEDNVNSTNNVNAASTNEVNVVDVKTSIELPLDPNMPELEDYSIFEDDEDVGAEAGMNNLNTTIQVSPILTTRIQKDHPLDQVIRDLQSALQTKRMLKNLEAHGAFLYGKIEEDVYVCQPPGFEDLDFLDRVYNVEKPLYGLHQAPRAWYETLSTYLLDNEFQRGKIDKTLFIKRYKDEHEQAPTPTVSSQQPSQLNVQDKELAFKLQAEEEGEERLAKEKAQQIEEVNIAWDDVQARQRRKHFAAKRAEEKRNIPPTRAQQRSFMCTYLKNVEGWKPKDLKNKSFVNIQELFDKAMKRVNTFVDYKTELVEESSKKAEAEIAQESSLKRACTELEQESIKKEKVDEDKETTKLQRLIESIPDKEGVAIDAIPLATKTPSIVDYKIHKEGKKTYYQIIMADGSSKMYLVFSHMLKSFDREDLETLWKLVKAKHGSTRPEEGYERVIWGDLKTMFDPYVEDQV